MRKVLNVAEKPSIAKHMSQALSINGCRTIQSQSKFNPIYVFDGSFLNQPAQVTITSVTGHIQEIEFPNEYKNWSTVDPLVLLNEAQVFISDSNDKLPVIKNLEKLSKDHTDLFLWLDCDREGEAIAYEVIGICNRTNKNLRIYRAKFSSVSKGDLCRAFNNPGQPNPFLNEAVLVRQEIDLRSGACFTRLQTLTIRKYFPKALEKSIASYGPCQFPTLHFIVERYLNHIAFTNMNFWTLNLILEKNQTPFEMIWNRQKLFDKLVAAVIYEIEMNDPRAIVTNLTRRAQKRFKPLPLTTVELQKLAVSKLKMSSDIAMKVAESLYTRGFISYPRTETNSFPTSFDFKKIISSLKSNNEYTAHAHGLLEENKFSKPRGGTKDDKAHPPIHPVKHFDGDKTSNEFKLFDLVSRHFLANCSEDADTEVVEVQVRVGNEFFHSSGLQIIQKNFLNIYEKFYYIKEKTLPALVQGEVVPIKEFTLKQGQTTPPKLMNEQDLIGLMDKHGIGTDATIHEHIKTIQDRNYAVKVNGNFKPTQLGIAILGAYQKIHLALGNPENRAQTEKNLALVAQGSKSRPDLLRQSIHELETAYLHLINNMDQFLRIFREIFENFFYLSNVELEADAAEPGEYNQQNFEYRPPKNIELDRCICQIGVLRIVISKSSKYFVGCSKFPNCNETYFFEKNIKSVKQSNKYCEVCHSTLLILNTSLEIEGEDMYCIHRNCQKSIFEILVKPSRQAPELPIQNLQQRPITRSPPNPRIRQDYTRERQELDRGLPPTANSRTMTCFKCNQPGHFANACPEGSSNFGSSRGNPVPSGFSNRVQRKKK
jgi:DNA topoisomerase-3